MRVSDRDLMLQLTEDTYDYTIPCRLLSVNYSFVLTEKETTRCISYCRLTFEINCHDQ